MTIRSWVKFFVHTLIIGGLVSGILGFVIRWNEFSPFFASGEWKEVFSIFAWLVGVGFTFSVISQMGFFAYLTVHQFGYRMFRSYWNTFQLLIIGVVLFDLVYFRFQAFAGEGESITSYLLLSLVLLAAGLITAYFKARQSNKSVFISALFFMIVITVLEWLPVLQANEESWLYLMLLTLLPCNAFQLLALPKYNERVKGSVK
ncbi:KinB signaling pathway activation protein [Bacillus ectoiniformans]|uniref:KinB-signaling pathway activation protein n=1 Tax=Bacillus ectoiniformans TaxID=1494429 RepID=UPI00195DF15A|nr:KinB signaling pathway activation protein [Bacillus ectoiniformans]